jgi:hypothetical protein
MRKERFLMGMWALAFALALAACGGKTAQAQTGGGNAAVDAAADLKEAAGAVMEAVGAVTGGGQPATAADFIYELSEAGDGVVITGIQKDAKFGAHLVVPSEIEGFPVVAFLAHYDDDSAKEKKQPPLESVIFPDSIIYLGKSDMWVDVEVYNARTYSYGRVPEADYAELAQFEKYDKNYQLAKFSSSKSLKRVVFPKNLKIIPAHFASSCPSLTTESITWPEAPVAIGPGAFSGNSFTELVIPEGVKFIGASLDGAFSGSKTLKSVTIPESIEVIGAETFSGCPELSAVNIPTHPIKYSMRTGHPRNDSFSGCPKLGLAAQVAISDTGYPDF